MQIESEQNKTLDFIWLELTKKCNLECNHCYAGSTPRHPLIGRMNTEDWLDVMSQARELGCEKIQFIGGEPTLHPDLHILLRNAQTLGFTYIEVFTNATRITPELCQIFRSSGTRVATSFYSGDSKSHEENTNSVGSYNLTISGISQLVDAGIPLRVEYIALTESDELYSNGKALLKRLGVEQISQRRLQNVGRTKGSYSRFSIGDYCGNCGNSRVCVSNNGKIHPCIMSYSIELGNIFNNKLGDALKSTGLLKFRYLLETENQALQVHEFCGPDGDGCAPDCCAPDAACGPDGGCGPDDLHCGPDHD
jgi:MoaA/NifB/PqqE/SkfB family radical SAM enzyme